MDPIRANFNLVKVDEKTYDVLLFADGYVLNSFREIYTNVHIIENSVFNNGPVLVVPGFEKREHAKVWMDYWTTVFEDPDNACKTCPTVNSLIGKIENARQKTK